ncbi:tRNA (adenosine(37)-N6)-threonylcarbamoyltransferase complex dimerization subunit type 1 TsaB [Bauldia sp.]|uniref:tRNA (adenosine(37)-N6)-threonylcarbamoyltransferase complex dimerization subunit type 1 TsaB n=1 Tax=Bauldia sp. TaxID=2575872 RepID=UPI003BA8F9D1
MRLLAIDTAGERCSAAVAAVDSIDLILRTETIGRGHAERLFALVAEVMADAGLDYGQLDRIAVTVGPGSFTGLRVGIAAARGLALATGCPVVSVGTLAAAAERARTLAGPVPVVAALDARRDEIYAQAFAADGAPVTEPAVGLAARFAALIEDNAMLAGSAADVLADAAGVAADRIAHRDAAPDIASVVRLGLAAPDPDGPPRPLYLRPPDAKPSTRAAVARR